MLRFGTQALFKNRQSLLAANIKRYLYRLKKCAIFFSLNRDDFLSILLLYLSRRRLGKFNRYAVTKAFQCYCVYNNINLTFGLCRVVYLYTLYFGT